MTFNGLFITGTDTDIGKTIVAAGVLRCIRNLGVDIVPAKPIQSGAVMENGNLKSQDLSLSLKAVNLTPTERDLKLMSPYLFPQSCSPHLAAQLAGQEISIQHIRRSVFDLASEHDGIIAEGAGGVLVPINERDTMLDLMVLLALPVILVARNSLGTINHSLLSLKVLKDAGVNVLGIIFCNAMRCDDNYISKDNPVTIQQFGDTRVLGQIPFSPAFADEDISDHAWDDFATHITAMDIIMDAIT